MGGIWRGRVPLLLCFKGTSLEGGSFFYIGFPGGAGAGADGGELVGAGINSQLLSNGNDI